MSWSTTRAGQVLTRQSRVLSLPGRMMGTSSHIMHHLGECNSAGDVVQLLELFGSDRLAVFCSFSFSMCFLLVPHGMECRSCLLLQPINKGSVLCTGGW